MFLLIFLYACDNNEILIHKRPADLQIPISPTAFPMGSGTDYSAFLKGTIVIN